MFLVILPGMGGGSDLLFKEPGGEDGGRGAERIETTPLEFSRAQESSNAHPGPESFQNLML